MNRSQFLISGAAAVLLSAPFSLTTAIADDVLLKSAEIKLHTDDHQKDGGSLAFFLLMPRYTGYNPDYHQAVADSGLLGTNPDTTYTAGSVNGPWPLRLNTNIPLRFADWPNAWLYNGFTPSGTNNWTYDVHLRLHWSDGSTTALVCNDMEQGASSRKFANEPDDIRTKWMKLGRDMAQNDTWWG